MADEPTIPPHSGGRAPGGRITPSPLRYSVSTATERIQVIVEAAEKAAAGIIEDAETQARRYLQESQQRADEIADERAKVIAELTDELVDRASTVKHHSDELVEALDNAKTQIDRRLQAELSAMGGTEIDAPAPSEADPSALREVPAAEKPSMPTQEPPTEEPPIPHLTSVEAPGPGSEPEALTETGVGEEGEPESSFGPEVIPFTAAAPEGEPVDAPEVSVPDQEPPATPDLGSLSTSSTEPSDGARLLATQMAVAGSSRDEIESRLRNEFGIKEAASMLDNILGPEA